MKIIELKNKLGELIISKKWEPVGTIKMFDREQDMSKMYYGTWKLTLKERSPIGVNPNSTEDRFKVAGNQFGEKEHTLTIDELTEHGHSLNRNSGYPLVSTAYSGETGWGVTSVGAVVDGGVVVDKEVSKAGSSKAHNNIHPVETIYFYKRIA